MVFFFGARFADLGVEYVFVSLFGQAEQGCFLSPTNAVRRC